MSALDLPDAVCGCLGCRKDAAGYVDHPTHGKLAVCIDHLEEMEVNGSV